MRLEGAMIFVEDLDRMTTFYRDIIGLQIAESPRLADWVQFESGGAGLALHAIPPSSRKPAKLVAPPTPREQSSCKLMFEVGDLEAELTRLEGLGVMILRRPWGGWDAVDPEGNVLGFRSRTD